METVFCVPCLKEQLKSVLHRSKRESVEQATKDSENGGIQQESARFGFQGDAEGHLCDSWAGRQGAPSSSGSGGGFPEKPDRSQVLKRTLRRQSKSSKFR